MAKRHTPLRNANLILSAFTWRADGINASASIACNDALNCALRGDASGCVQRSLDALRHRYGVGHRAYRRAQAIAIANGFEPIGHSR